MIGNTLTCKRDIVNLIVLIKESSGWCIALFTRIKLHIKDSDYEIY